MAVGTTRLSWLINDKQSAVNSLAIDSFFGMTEWCLFWADTVSLESTSLYWGQKTRGFFWQIKHLKRFSRYVCASVEHCFNVFNGSASKGLNLERVLVCRTLACSTFSKILQLFYEQHTYYPTNQIPVYNIFNLWMGHWINHSTNSFQTAYLYRLWCSFAVALFGTVFSIGK